jgi:hypothetical protein
MLEHERRLDNTIPHGQFGDGEGVEVKTKMGSTKTQGIVMSVLPSGLIIRESTGETKFYNEGIYLFTSLEREPPVVVQNQLHDMSVDQKVRQKLIAMGEAGDPTPDNTGARPLDPDAKDDEYGDKGDDKSTKDDYGDKEKDDSKGDKKKSDAVADPDSSIDVEKLPDDIQHAIITTDEMDESQLNGVLSDISNATLKALKRTGIDERQIFGLVQKINDASYAVLTGEKSNRKEG